MDVQVRHQRIWNILYDLVHPWFPRFFHFSYDEIDAEGPILLVCNHVTCLDSLLLGLAMGKKQIYYVSTEHILRSRFTGWLLKWVFDPIPRRKGADSLDTVRKTLRHLRQGHSVCLFAEGEQSWDGRTIPVVPGSGSLARACQATLVTYRLEGGYLQMPRWGRGVRKGSIRGRLQGVYPPEVLKAMSTEEVNRLMEKDIQENAWERQKTEKVPYRGGHLAEYLERALYLCPSCRRIGTLSSHGEKLACTCGLNIQMTETGIFSEGSPFQNVAEWDDWQRTQLRERNFLRDENSDILFSDGDITLTCIGEGHQQTVLCSGTLNQTEEAIQCGTRTFSLNSIEDMAMSQAEVLLFTCEGSYYELRGRRRTNMRKYLEVWKQKQGN